MNKPDSQSGLRKKITHYSYSPSQALGKGYSSLVYRGQDDLTEQQVAIKMIDMKNVKGDVHKSLLSNEIEILKLMKNMQNVIEVYDILMLKTHTCIVTELCEGGDLAKKIKQSRCLPQAQALSILKQIINGYRGINRFGVVHRDLKPANIFFVNDASNTIKIADFGFAIRSSQLKKAANYNVGSPVYMPLQALNDNVYSSKSDVWAIGVIFYEMLTGKTPWKARTETDLKRQIKALPINGLLPAGISEVSAEFLKGALQVNQTLRMTPEEMERHFAGDQDGYGNGISNAINLTSTKLRTNNLFRTRAISNEREERPNPDRTDSLLGKAADKGKATVTAPKTMRKTNFLQSIHDGLHDQLHLTSKQEPLHLTKLDNLHATKLDNLHATKAQNLHLTRDSNYHQLRNDNLHMTKHDMIHPNPTQALTRTTATLGLTGEHSFFDHKKTSNHLISQIHFCRFIYKLITKLQQLRGVDEGGRMKELMGAAIFIKLRQIINLKGISARYAPIFKSSKEFDKILNVVEQYKLKYKNILQAELQNPQNDAQTWQEFISQLTQCILSLYATVTSLQQIQHIKEEIIMLDYLITLKQLLHLSLSVDLESFHLKSKIEAIVEGKPAKTITEGHLKAIEDKMRAIKLV